MHAEQKGTARRAGEQNWNFGMALCRHEAVSNIPKMLAIPTAIARPKMKIWNTAVTQTPPNNATLVRQCSLFCIHLFLTAKWSLTVYHPVSHRQRSTEHTAMRIPDQHRPASWPVQTGCPLLSTPACQRSKCWPLFPRQVSVSASLFLRKFFFFSFTSNMA